MKLRELLTYDWETFENVYYIFNLKKFRKLGIKFEDMLDYEIETKS